MKGKKVVSTLNDPNDVVTADKVAAALGRRYRDFSFSHELVPVRDPAPGQPTLERAVLADGPWHVKANLRPSLDRIVKFAEGYLTCLLDARNSVLEQTAAVEAVLAKEEP